MKLSVKDIVNTPTLRGQAALVSGAGPATTAPAAPRRDLFEPDLRLPADIHVSGPVPRGPVENVLLTGATGFIGAHLLHELLARTSATVHADAISSLIDAWAGCSVSSQSPSPYESSWVPGARCDRM